ncbi:hypothetical protein [Streptomyces jumonjinensis]|nr:hypothetical protein [Streptomyces jumonjinensis]
MTDRAPLDHLKTAFAGLRKPTSRTASGRRQPGPRRRHRPGSPGAA